MGTGAVIKGWDQSLIGMCIGELRKIVVPSDLGYGDAGALPKIPPGATLVFEIELLDILPPDQEDDDSFAYYDQDDDADEEVAEFLRWQEEMKRYELEKQREKQKEKQTENNNDEVVKQKESDNDEL